jgi:hypothetical protein
MVYGGTRILWFERFEAWQRTKFEAKLNINEKIEKIMVGWRGGSRIQDIFKGLPVSPAKLKGPLNFPGNVD